MKQFTIKTQSRTDFINIDAPVKDALAEMGIKDGFITVFIPHTTAGITINENADPDVTADMTDVFDEIIPWHGNYRHGEGNTAAHVKATLTGASTQIIVENGRLQLGTWQSLYFCEFDGPRTRNVWVKGMAAS